MQYDDKMFLNYELLISNNNNNNNNHNNNNGSNISNSNCRNDFDEFANYQNFQNCIVSKIDWNFDHLTPLIVRTVVLIFLFCFFLSIFYSLPESVDHCAIYSSSISCIHHLLHPHNIHDSPKFKLLHSLKPNSSLSLAPFFKCVTLSATSVT